MSCCSECAFKHINQGSTFLDDCRISGYFDTKFVAVVLLELILRKFERLKTANILNLEEVYFLVTRVIYGCVLLSGISRLKLCWIWHLWAFVHSPFSNQTCTDCNSTSSLYTYIRLLSSISLVPFVDIPDGDKAGLALNMILLIYMYKWYTHSRLK